MQINQRVHSGPRILYCGYLKVPYMQQDRDLLAERFNLETFDYSATAARFTQIPLFAIKCFTQIIPGVFNNKIIWINSADYPALPFVILAKLLNKKTVVMIQGHEIYPPNEIGYGFQMKLIRGWIARWLIRNADMNVVMSESYMGILYDLDPSANFYIMPGCVEASCYNPDFDKKEECAVTAYCDWNMSEKLKGIQTFRTAQVHSRYKMQVIFNRSHKTMIAAFLRSKVYCQLSYTESFGISLLEAMACGCVPVVTDRGALPEVVGDCGVIVPYGDVASTVEAIDKAMRMDGRAARIQAESFTADWRRMHMHHIIQVVMGFDGGKR